MANVLGVTAFKSGTVLQEWWQYTLVAILSVSGLVGVIAFVWTSYNAIRKLLTVRVLLLPQRHALKLIPIFAVHQR
jgi:hypothetical protein